ncbi:MAG: hypothetical protein HONBIEJF_01688 [Fimbriimonadaceae bacterium]|nr:hypothetical protein [Fimbriimonadaceae bacterium]
MNSIAVGLIVATSCGISTEAYLRPLFLDDLSPIRLSGIYEAVSKPSIVVRPHTVDQGTSREFQTQRFRILDLATEGRSGELSVLFSQSSVNTYPQFEPGARVLLFLAPKVNGRLSVRNGSRQGWEDGVDWHAAEEDDGCAWSWLPIMATKIPAGQTPEVRLFRCLLEEIAVASEANKNRILEFFHQCRYPGAKAHFRSKGGEATEFHEAVRTLAAKVDGETSARLLWLLNDWCIRGSARWYLDAVMKLASAPTVFASWVEIPPVRFWEEPDPLTGKGRSFELPNPNDWAVVAATSKNLKVTAFVLSQLGFMKPDEAHEKLMAPLLDSPDAEIRYYLARHYAMAQDVPEHQPSRTVLTEPRFVIEYSGLQEAVAFWKNYWKVE